MNKEKNNRGKRTLSDEIFKRIGIPVPPEKKPIKQLSSSSISNLNNIPSFGLQNSMFGGGQQFPPTSSSHFPSTSLHQNSLFNLKAPRQNDSLIKQSSFSSKPSPLSNLTKRTLVIFRSRKTNFANIPQFYSNWLQLSFNIPSNTILNISPPFTSGDYDVVFIVLVNVKLHDSILDAYNIRPEAYQCILCSASQMLFEGAKATKNMEKANKNAIRDLNACSSTGCSSGDDSHDSASQCLVIGDDDEDEFLDVTQCLRHFGVFEEGIISNKKALKTAATNSSGLMNINPVPSSAQQQQQPYFSVPNSSSFAPGEATANSNVDEYAEYMWRSFLCSAGSLTATGLEELTRDPQYAQLLANFDKQFKNHHQLLISNVRRESSSELSDPDIRLANATKR